MKISINKKEDYPLSRKWVNEFKPIRFFRSTQALQKHGSRRKMSLLFWNGQINSNQISIHHLKHIISQKKTGMNTELVTAECVFILAQENGGSIYLLWEVK